MIDILQSLAIIVLIALTTVRAVQFGDLLRTFKNYSDMMDVVLKSAKQNNVAEKNNFDELNVTGEDK